MSRAIAHNVLHGEQRHGGRPLCDTTHYQVFLGAVTATPLRHADVAPMRFAAGGNAAWQIERSRSDVTAALGAFEALHVQDLQAAISRPSQTSSDDGIEVVGCEVLRSALALPSCPRNITDNGQSMVFAGTGAGHGLGLDVADAQKRSDAGESSDAILKRVLQRTR